MKDIIRLLTEAQQLMEREMLVYEPINKNGEIDTKYLIVRLQLEDMISTNSQTISKLNVIHQILY